MSRRELEGTEIPGLRPARDGLQPVSDLAAFLNALPDFGEDAVRLREVIAEDRASRRAGSEDGASRTTSKTARGS